jgi:Tol biopolymer transport system component
MRFAWTIALAVVLLPGLTTRAQPRAVRTETLPLGKTHAWSMPRWSPDGKRVLYTSADCNGIWAYTVGGGNPVQVTSDRGSGWGFSVSENGARVAYRRTLTGTLPGEVLQEAVIRDVAGGAPSVLATGTSITVPVFIRSDVVFSVGGQLQGVDPGDRALETVKVLGIEDSKIALLRGGVKLLIDPLGNGKYLWPSLSPDGARLVACESERGAFVADSDGSHPLRIGRRDAPDWTRDGKWLIYMSEENDSRGKLATGIGYVSPDGKMHGILSSPARGGAMYPHVSPVADEIVCCTRQGEVLVITYSEASR